MHRVRHRSFILVLVLVLCCGCVMPVQAQIAGVRKAKAVPVLLGVGAAGALLVYGVYSIAHRGHSLRGCTSAGISGTQLLNEGDQQMYALSGSVPGIPAGERVRVSGSKQASAGPTRGFVVSRVSKDYGSCSTKP